MYNVLGFFANLFDFYLMMLLCQRFCPKRVNSPWLKVGAILLLALATAYFKSVIGNSLISVYILAALLVTLYIFYHNKIWCTISFVIWFAVLSISEYAVVFFISLITGSTIDSIITNNSIYTIITLFVSRIMNVTIVFFIVRSGKKGIISSNLEVYQLFVIVLSLVMMSNIFIQYNNILHHVPTTNAFLAYLTISNTFFLLSILYMQNRQIAIARKKEKLALMEQQIKIQTAFAGEVEAMVEVLRELNHDYRNHLQQFQSLIDNNMVSEANSYLHELLESYSGSILGLIENRQAISLLIIEKKKLASKRHINFNYIVPSELETDIKESDLCVILSNLLDNSIENVMSDGDNKIIELKIEVVHDLLLIDVLNSVSHKIEKNEAHFLTTKEDKSNHGFGLKSVRRIVSGYDGMVEIDTDSNYFKVSIILPVHSV